MLKAFPYYSCTMLYLAGCYAEVGQADEARPMLARLAEEHGITSLDGFPARLGNQPGVTDRLTAQLARVGWPFEG